MFRRLPFPIALFLLACDPVPGAAPGKLVLTAGQETGVWSRDPAPTRATAQRTPEGGSAAAYLTLAVPPTEFSMQTEAVASYAVQGVDDSDTLRVWGNSSLLDETTLAGTELPLFVQRTGEFARPPGRFALDHGQRPPVAGLAERWLLVAGDAEAGYVGTEAYDLGMWRVETAPALRCPDATAVCRPRTVAVVSSGVIVAIGDDWLRSFAFDDQDGGVVVSYVDAGLPDGMNEFSEVAGGQVVTAPDGDVYVVGATHAEAPSATVLRIVPGSSGTAEVTLRVLSLGTPRAGAAATWVADQGLVVLGGSPVGAGLEVLAEGGSEFVAQPYPSDATVGAAVAPVAADAVLRVGGRDANDQPAATVRLALTCAADCVAEPAGDPVDLRDALAYAFDDGAVLAVGVGPDGQAAVVRRTDAATESVPLRAPRSGASSARLATGHVAVVGGALPDGTAATAPELFAPF